jgi:hypothetical protein
VLGVLAVGKALTTPVAPVSAHRAVDEATVGAGFNQDTLAKGDRLEITYVSQETPARAVHSERPNNSSESRDEDHKPALARSERRRLFRTV